MQSINTFLQNCASKTPDQNVYIFLENGENESETLTFASLNSVAKGIAVELRTHFAVGERLMLIYPPGLEFIKVFFGCLYAGVVPVPAFPPIQPDHIDRLFAIANNASVAGVLTTTKMQPLIQLQIEIMGLSGQLTCFTANASPDETFVPVSPAECDLAYLQYTSGSTGTPKGVMVTHGSLMANEQAIYDAFGHSSKTIGCGWLPVYHDMGLVGTVIQPIFYGGSVVLMSPLSFLKRPISWLRAISNYRVTTSGAPNFAYDLCVRRFKPEMCNGLDLSSWEVAFCGAEPVRAETLRRFSEAFTPYGFRPDAFYPCYGLAEATLMVSGPQKLTTTTVLQVDREQLENDHVIAPANGHSRFTEIVSCGRAWRDTQLLIVDPESLLPCPPSVIGEIWVAGSSVTAGYWQNPVATAETFHCYTAKGDGPYLRTGDLGFIHRDEIFLSGRLKDMLIIRGRNYFPQDIENAIDSCHPALRPGKCAAFAVDDGIEENLVIVAEVNRDAMSELDVNAIAVAIQSTVGMQFQINLSNLVLLASGKLPQTTSGKVRRTACRDGYIAGSLNSVGQWRNDAPDIG